MASKSELPLYVESPGWFRRRRLFVALGGASVIYCLCFFAFTLHDLRLTEQVSRLQEQVHELEARALEAQTFSREEDEDDDGEEEGDEGEDDDTTLQEMLKWRTGATWDATSTPAEIARYEDATSVFGDVELLSEIHSADTCNDLCLESARCAAWTLHRVRALCMLRLVGVPLVTHGSDLISGRLSEEELATRHAEWLNATADRGAENAATADTDVDDLREQPEPYVYEPYAGPRWAQNRSSA